MLTPGAYADLVVTEGDPLVTIEDAARDPTRRPVLIFPEGMCGNGRAVCSFKTGAFAPGLSLQPVVVDYRGNRSMDPAWVTIGPSALRLPVNVPLTSMPSPSEVIAPALVKSPPENVAVT